PVAASRTNAVSSPPVAMSLPSGEYAAQLNSPGTSTAVLPVAARQMRSDERYDLGSTGVSHEPAIIFPSGEKVRHAMKPVSPSRRRSSLPVAVSHSRMAL